MCCAWIRRVNWRIRSCLMWRMRSREQGETPAERGANGGNSGRFAHWEADAESRAFADFGLYFDSSAVAFDDIFADCQAQAGAFGFAAANGAFGGEEGLEDF